MKNRIFLLSLLYFLFISTNAKAYNIPNSNIYREGIYRVDTDDECKVIVKRLSNYPTSLIVFEEDNSVVFYLMLPYNKEVELKQITKRNTIGIIGKAEVTIKIDVNKCN